MDHLISFRNPVRKTSNLQIYKRKNYYSLESAYHSLDISHDSSGKNIDNIKDQTSWDIITEDTVYDKSLIKHTKIPFDHHLILYGLEWGIGLRWYRFEVLYLISCLWLSAGINIFNFFKKGLSSVCPWAHVEHGNS